MQQMITASGIQHRLKTQFLKSTHTYTETTQNLIINLRIIIGSDRRPETKQGIEGKIDRFRSARVRVKDRVRVRFRSAIWFRSAT